MERKQEKKTNRRKICRLLFMFTVVIIDTCILERYRLAVCWCHCAGSVKVVVLCVGSGKLLIKLVLCVKY